MPALNLPILLSIQPAEFWRLGSKFSLKILSEYSDILPIETKIWTPVCVSCAEIIDNIVELGIRATKSGRIIINKTQSIS